MMNVREGSDQRNARAFLMTPREAFIPKAYQSQAYAITYLDLGYGGFITDPATIAMMNGALEVRPGDKVLEIGTGSGYQSAYLSNLTDRVSSIEIIRPLYDRATALYADLIQRGYREYRGVTRVHGDGYYGWADGAPFDKIIVTCGIDHIPPPLLQQLAPNGTMLIPVGPPGAQRVLKVTKKTAADGTTIVARSDIFNGLVLSFMSFASLVDNQIVGTHYSN
jgi:protein-L-isoaspartate(D-aspartate) O-methyltransferase